MLVVGLLLGTVALSRADEKPKPQTVSLATLKLTGGKLLIERQVEVVVNVPVSETVNVIINGKTVTQTVTKLVPQTKTEIVTLLGDNFEVQDLAGKTLDTAKLAEVLKTNNKALFPNDGKPIDPASLKGAKEGTLVLVPIKTEAPKKEPSPPKD